MDFWLGEVSLKIGSKDDSWIALQIKVSPAWSRLYYNIYAEYKQTKVNFNSFNIISLFKIKCSLQFLKIFKEICKKKF